MFSSHVTCTEYTLHTTVKSFLDGRFFYGKKVYRKLEFFCYSHDV